MFGLFKKRKFNEKEFKKAIEKLFTFSSELILKSENIEKDKWFQCLPEIKIWLYSSMVDYLVESEIDENEIEQITDYILSEVLFNTLNVDFEDESHVKLLDTLLNDRMAFYELTKDENFYTKFYRILFDHPLNNDRQLEEIPPEFDFQKSMTKAMTAKLIIKHFEPTFITGLVKVLEKSGYIN